MKSVPRNQLKTLPNGMDAQIRGSWFIVHLFHRERENSTDEVWRLPEITLKFADITEYSPAFSPDMSLEGDRRSQRRCLPHFRSQAFNFWCPLFPFLVSHDKVSVRHSFVAHPTQLIIQVYCTVFGCFDQVV